MDTVTSADGTAIAYDRTGTGAPLVLVHGTGRNHAHWARSLPGLEQHATVYAVDRRGRGGSGDTERYALEHEVDDILAVIGAIGEPVHLLGHSYGGIVALEAAASRSDQLRGLILYEPPLTLGKAVMRSDLEERLDEFLVAGDREAALVTFLREGPRYPPAVIEAQRALPEWPERLSFVHTVPRELRTVQEYVFDAKRFATLPVPTLLLLGSESPPPFRLAIEALDATLPRRTVVMLPDQHHNAMEAAAELFTATVERFLRDGVGGEGERSGTRVNAG